jgi:hypothetical protein
MSAEATEAATPTEPSETAAPPTPPEAPETAATPAQAKKAPKAPKEPRKPSGLDVAAQVLADKGEPMTCKDIVETMLAKGMWTTGGKTPAATIYSAMLREIDGKPGASRFVKTGRGLFGLTSMVIATPAHADAAPSDGSQTV